MGTVRDARGNPIAGAAISFFPRTGEWFSDERGQFVLPGYIEVVYASKPGYESAISWAWDGVEMTLHDIIRIQPGQSVRMTVRPNDSLGGRGLSYRVRTIRVFSGGDRIVSIQVLADDNGSVDYRVQDNCGDLCPRNPPTFFIEGGGERQVHIQIPDNSTASRTFTVITSASDP